MNSFQQKLLSYLQIDEKDLPLYLKEASYDDLESPNVFLEMEKATQRINSAIKNKEKIMIYGDYDCDGISSTAILVKMFQYLGIKVGYYIPSRYIDGYGINLTRAEQIKNKGYTLVITVDNGVSAFDALEYLKQENIDVILTDHHEITRELPPCHCVIHPDLKNNQLHLKECGAYVAFMLSISVLNRIDDYLLTLAGQATISDMMPLIGYNRNLVKLTLLILNKHQEYPQHLLLENSQIIDEEVLGYTICPKINAFGRIKEDLSINDMVRFFVTEDLLIQKKIAQEIEIVNNTRKNLLFQAIQKVDINSYSGKNLIILRNDEISEGVIGLVAARLLNELNKPSIVFTKVKDQDVLKGSARSLKGFSLSDAFSKVSPLLLVYGGHEEAGGLSISIENYEKFVEQISNLAQDVVYANEDKFLELIDDDLTYDNYIFLRSLSPFGVGYSLPKFLLHVSHDKVCIMGKENQHIRGKISNNVSFVGFSLANQIMNRDDLPCLGSLNYDTFRKGNNIVFRIEKII